MKNQLYELLFLCSTTGKQTRTHPLHKTALSSFSKQSRHCFLITTKGKASMQVDDHRYDLIENTVALIDTSLIEISIPKNSGIWEYYYIAFDQRDMQTYYRYLKAHEKLVVPYANLSLIQFSAKRIISAERKTSQIDFKTSRLISDILYEMLDFSFERYRPDLLVDNIIRYIHSHYQEKIELQSIANQFYINKNYLCDLFKKTLNMTLYSYLIQFRIERSKELLEQTNMSLTEISQQCGFSSVNHFISTFHKLLGITPTKFRKSRIQKLSNPS